MDVKSLIVGELETNCYIISKDNKAIIIDPGDESLKISSYIKEKNYTVEKILITHHHFDHIGALNELKELYNVEVIDYSTKERNFRGLFNFSIIENPGHTYDSITFYFPNEHIMFIGDFIFKNGIGRTDLPTGNNNEMLKSLYMMRQFPRETLIYPGHGESSYLGEELDKWIK